jgi:N-acetyl-alpha-D-muramate 1-phosphate uridylyltransferase
VSGVSQAIVLSAGLGTRMRPLTDQMPKPLVKLGGKPLIDHVLDRLAAAGVTRAAVNVHYMAEMLEAHLASRRRPGIVISDERDGILDTGGGVVRALPLLSPASFFVHNSDSVWMEGAVPVLERMIARWDEEAMDALLLLAPMDNVLGFGGKGDFTMDGEGRLARRGDADSAPYVFAGVSIAHPRLLEGCGEEVFSLNRSWDRAIASGRLFGIRHDGLWMHVGDPQALAEAEAVLQRAGASV